MFQNCVSFQKATEMFYSMQYEQGLDLINDCIANDNNNSILYSNRALFYSQLGSVQQALSDLNLAIQLNHLNYIAYFNMFSLLMRIQKFDQAFQNLCCSLSCLYLIRAKTKKSQLDASKAIKYAENNLQAHVLKGLIHLENGKYKLALNELDWACEIDPKHEIVRNIRKIIFKKMNPGLSIDYTQFQTDEQEVKNQFLRLQSSYTIEQSDKEKELRDKILEFNEIYNNLNDFQGTITTKVPKDEQQTNLNTATHILDQSSKEETNNQEQRAETNQRIDIDNRGLQKNQEKKTNNQTMMDDNEVHVDKQNAHYLAQEVAKRLIVYQANADEQVLFEIIPQTNSSFALQSRQNSHLNHSSAAVLADKGLATPSSASLEPEPGQYALNSQNVHLYDSITVSQSSKSFQSITHKQTEQQIDRFSEFQSMIHSHNSEKIKHSQSQKYFQDNFESIMTQNNNQNQEISIISNTLYPKPDNAMIQFSILKLQLLNMSQQEVTGLQNLYCIANYMNVKEGGSHSNFKLRTACQKGSNNGTQWNETFDPIEIPQNPECMKIKVYNKKYSSYRDDLIGQMEVEITTHGLVKLPLFNKKGEISGSLLMNLALVFGSIEEVDEQDEV